MLGSDVVDEVLAYRVPEARYALVLYVRLIEQLHRATDVRAEDVHGVAALPEWRIGGGVGAIDLIASRGFALVAAVEPDVQVVRVVQLLDLQHLRGVALARVHLVDFVSRAVFLQVI